MGIMTNHFLQWEKFIRELHKVKTGSSAYFGSSNIGHILGGKFLSGIKNIRCGEFIGRNDNNQQLERSDWDPLWTHSKRFSAAFQLITFQMALKYSALRFSYWRLSVDDISELAAGTLKGKLILLISMLPSINPQQWFKLPNDGVLILTNPGFRLVSCGSALLLLQKRRTHCISLHANGPCLFVLHQPSPSTSLNPS